MTGGVKAKDSESRSKPLPSIRPEIVAIGVSTGGPTALASVISAFPAAFPLPIVVTQHMPAHFIPMLAARLANQSAMVVQEGVEGAVVEGGKVYIAPGDRHLAFVREGAQVRIHLNDDPPENSCKPAVDVMLRSVVKCYGGKAIAVILTGMGQDGLKGCIQLRDAGGIVIVQDEESSVVWGMPGAVADAGISHKVVPLTEITDLVCTLAMTPAGAMAPAGGVKGTDGSKLP